MTSRFLATAVLLLAAPFHVSAADPPKSSELAAAVSFSATVAAAKDVSAVAALLQDELRRPLDLWFQVKDTESLTKAKTTLNEVTANIDTVTKRLLQLPVPPAAERKALSKKMAASDRAHLKTKQAALKAHMESMPEELKKETMAAMDGFYKTVEDHQKVFEMYLTPGGKSGSKPQKTEAKKSAKE